MINLSMILNLLSDLSGRFLAVWVSLAPFLLFGALLAGLLHVILPATFIRTALHGSRGVWRAVLIGIPLPLCSCGVIPAGLGLRRDGASKGATVGFLVSTPQTGVDSILVSASLLGLPFAIYKVLAATITGLIGGLMTDRFDQNIGQSPHSSTQAQSSETGIKSDHAQQSTSSSSSRLRNALEHSESILESIWGWVLIGVFASALIDYTLPDTLLKGPDQIGPLGPSALGWAYMITLAISLPLYVCATASVPIAAILVTKGFPVGVALVFLMAGPATNIATLGSVYRGLGKRALIVYLSIIIIGSLGFAFVLDWGLGWQVPADLIVNLHAHEHDGWKMIFAGVLGIWMLMQLGGWLREKMLWLSPLLSRGNQRIDTSDILHDQEHDVPISGLTCQGCVRRLKSSLMSRNDISECRVSPELDQLWVRGQLSVEDLSRAIHSAGFVSHVDDHSTEIS